MKKNKKNAAWKKYLVTACFMLIGFFCGFLIAEYLDKSASKDAAFGEYLITTGLLLIGLYAVIFVQIILHEAGHLVCGLLSGYRFSSFRIGSIMLVKEKGRIRLREFSLAGTGGQCLMIPPEMKNGKFPVILYNAGGPLMNLITGILFLGLWYLTKENRILSALSLMMSVTGFGFAALNGIPIRTGLIDNDGYNALSLGKNPDALRSLWVQLKAQELISQGVRLKDMPQEWFEVPSDEAMKNSMTAVMGVFACNRLMDEQRFSEANLLMKRLLASDNAIVGLHRSLMNCDRIFCELAEGNEEEASLLLDKPQKKFMKSMKKFPSVLRTEYVCALLLEKDQKKAEAVKARFEACAKKYPYPSDVQGERELIQIAEGLKLKKA